MDPSPDTSDAVGVLRLTASGLGHRFGARVLFRMVSIDIRGGRPVAVTGANGSGKSTLMRILAGVLRPSRGDVVLTLGGQDVAAVERPLYCGMVAPYLDVYEHFSAQENLEFICRVRSLDSPDIRVRRVLERVGLYNRREDAVRTFSSGMLQRVRIACALIADPPVLILDEPTATLDEAGIRLVHEIADVAASEGRIVIVSTNERREAERYSHRIRIEDFAPGG